MGNFETTTPSYWLPPGETEVSPKDRLGHDKPLVVFGGIPGETSIARITHDGRNRTYGVFDGTNKPHRLRVEPTCKRYFSCGGCPMMHLNDEGQQKARTWFITDALARNELSDVNVGQWHESPDGPSDFRHVIKLGIGLNEYGTIKVGAWGRNDRRVVPIPECTVAAPVLRETMKSVAHHIIDLNLMPYDPETDRGILRGVLLRASRTTGEVLVTIVAGRNPKKLQDLADRIAQGAPNISGIWVHINSDPGNAMFERDEEGIVPVRALLGKETIDEEIDGITYRVGPVDFFQTNPAMAQVLYKRTIERLELEKEVPFLDLYCGVGGFALHAARITGWALGIESGEGAVRRARESARRNSISAEFQAGSVLDLLPEAARRLNGARPVITVNPARRGLEHGVAEAILELEPRRIAYISCNPRALARDLKVFRDAGYTIGDLEAFDMFPNTAHVEVLAVLEGPKGNDDGRRGPRRRVVRR